jgi:hypothetical protein
MKQRQSYTGTPLPGKASNGFAKAKAGIREVNGYASYRGLSEFGGEMASVDARNNRNRRSADSYMGQVQSYLSKVRNGRSVREADPSQPALGPDAEVLRQTNAIDKANRRSPR